ncbi:MAG: DUF2892 domain-containing protein [Archangiaceae bacterium]|nr:DUF2892 domain-containing protein [Archangiaceae bacterium]
MKFFRTALYFKNVPLLERIIRVVLGVAMAALPLAFGRLAGALPLTVAMGAGIAMTGFVGFCPACYLIGRKLEARRPSA